MSSTISSRRTGYALAASSAAISGLAVYVNSLGVRMFADSTLYTTLKNAVVGIALVTPLLFIARRRHELARLSLGRWSLLIALALVSGSVPFLLFFRGLQLTNGVTGALLNHMQFVFVAIFAALALRERISPAMWAGLGALVVGTVIGTDVGAVRWNSGAVLVLASSVLFAAGFVLAKYLLRELSTLTVLIARMTMGAAALAAYAAATGHLQAVTQLGPGQWRFVLITAAILLAFSFTTFAAIRRVEVSAVMAVQMAAPAVTLLIQLVVAGRVSLPPVSALGLTVTMLAVALIVVAGLGSRPQMVTLDEAPS
jgi:drug/metabolite transporter (DMT)-like permease